MILKSNFKLTLSHPQDIRLDLKKFKQHFVTLMVVLKRFQKNLFHMFHSLARISWDTCVSLQVEQVVFPFHYEFSNSSGKSSKTLVNLQGLFLLLPIKNYISLIFFGRSKHKIQHITIYTENIYTKNSKRLQKYVKTKQKTTAFQRKYKVYIICTPKCDTFGNSFFPLLSIMECYKLNR